MKTRTQNATCQTGRRPLVLYSAVLALSPHHCPPVSVCLQTITIDAPLTGLGSTVNVSWTGLTGTGNQDCQSTQTKPQPASRSALRSIEHAYARAVSA